MRQPYYYVIDRGWKIKKSTKKLITGTLLLSGGILLSVWTAYPLIDYQIKYANNLENLTMVSPVSEGQILGQHTEMLNINQWFTSKPDLTWQKSQQMNGKEYYISIPSLKIKDAKVVIGSDDLSKNLIHYNGTALPGDIGASVIFGHSILPQFYNPKNYKAIFSTLHTLKNGSEIYVTFDGVLYKYIVDEHYVVEGDDFGVLAQPEGSRILKIITCTPPGTYLKRLVVKSHLEKYD